MTTAANLSILLICLQRHSVNSWVQSERAFIPQTSRLFTGAMDDEHFKNMRVDLFSPHASILNYHDTDTVHIGGLFESLTPLPVYEWAESDDDSDWMDFGNICREDECEQCEIPDDFKDPTARIDVLDFLGIQRAEPIEVKRKKLP